MRAQSLFCALTTTTITTTTIIALTTMTVKLQTPAGSSSMLSNMTEATHSVGFRPPLQAEKKTHGQRLRKYNQSQTANAWQLQVPIRTCTCLRGRHQFDYGLQTPTSTHVSRGVITAY
ncbi:unnamed protein product [Polarella glacialis]|uniref:Uncharacterized protein n=1 Tax=Polarella glacialis TaxID=89957 RepID=A0A813E4Z7_POLGL|nr:unnamed protein product [Polarella glacialis]